MIGAILGGLSAAGGIAGFMSGRKEKRWGRRNAAAAQLQADERLGSMDALMGDMRGERDLSMQMRDENRQRYAAMGFDEIEQDLANQVREGVDVEGQASRAADYATNQYDVSLDAQRRAMMAQGVRPGSAAMSRLGEDAAFDRSRMAAGSANVARTQADDQNFARRVAFADRGHNMRNQIQAQSGDIRNQYQGEFGMQGMIRGEYMNERNQQQARAQAGSEAMMTGATSLGSGMLGMAGGGAFGGSAQTAVNQYVRPTG